MNEISKNIWEIPRSGDMNVPAYVVASKSLLDKVEQGAIEQLKNVASLPTIVKGAFAMPDIHQGYGFPIGGVAAFDAENGIVSPGGVGYDINCGVRLLKTSLYKDDITPYMDKIIHSIYSNVPCGIGSKGRLKISRKELFSAITTGVNWTKKRGFADSADIDAIEDNGFLPLCDTSTLSERAIERGMPQLGSLGAGNHFIEIQYVSDIYDEKTAEKMGIAPGMVTVMIHTGSRGFGYQVCDDNLKSLRHKYGNSLNLKDKELIYAPISSDEGRKYISQMHCAANYAYVNRQIITHWIRESFFKVIGGNTAIDVVYDICHNIAKFEKHTVNGKERKLIVHRKGATRSLGAGNVLIGEKYRAMGQPIIIPGDMGRSSYLLTGTTEAEKETFGSTCHGAGRVLSRHKAIKATKDINLEKELGKQNIKVMAKSRRTLHEEASVAYKNISEVIDAVTGAGLGKKVVKMKPMGVIKG
ncbi:MAG: RNA-splicing ligase RtcB [Proteobacteria bacterium]|nr:RNA-splicing ligase RtcB [Pseudomonadota bacterium]